MFQPTRVLEIEIAHPLRSIGSLDPYALARILVRLHGVPLGVVTLPIEGGAITAAALREGILGQLQGALARQALLALVADPAADVETALAHTRAASPLGFAGPWPSLSIAVCTRHRAGALTPCLEALLHLDYPGELEVLIVDNAPSNDATECLVRQHYPRFRYVREERPGLDWARNRAISASTGELIAYTDDDVAVDSLWARALARVFAEDPAVMAVTGLVAPYELETPAQLTFEQYGGFGRGYEPRRFAIDRAAGECVATSYIATGKFGTGANMAYRRATFERIGAFDPALDVGTVTNGGGDLEMFYRVLKAGFVLAYEPQALVWHAHRRDEQRLTTQITNNGVGFYAYLVRCFLHFPEERLDLLRKGAWWFWYWYLYRLLLSFVRPVNITRDLIVAELRGAVAGLTRYQRAHRTARSMARPGDLSTALVAPAQTGGDLQIGATAVRVVDLSLPLRPITDVVAYPRVRLVVQRAGTLLGTCMIANSYGPITVTRLREEVVAQLAAPLLDEAARDEHDLARQLLDRRPAGSLAAQANAPRVAPTPAVSVVVLAHHGGAALEACLSDLRAQQGTRPYELVVVGADPACYPLAGLPASSPPVIWMPDAGAQGLRAAGLAAASGTLVAFVDGDLRLPPDWLDALIAPLADPATAVVVGSVFPAKLETRAQQLGARYNGIDRGGHSWPGPTWLTDHGDALSGWAGGALANLALRADRQREHLVATLAAASAMGVGEGSYLIYRLQHEGYGLAHAPRAYAWRTPTSAAGLSAQVHAVCAGQVAWRRLVWQRHHDARPLIWMARRLPRHYVQRIQQQLKALLRGGEREPLGLIAQELAGLASGVFGAGRHARRATPCAHKGPKAIASAAE